MCSMCSRGGQLGGPASCGPAVSKPGRAAPEYMPVVVEEENVAVDYGSANRNLKGEDTWRTQGPVSIGNDTVYLGGVFDGHGGRKASYLLREKLLGYVIEACCGDASAASLKVAGTTAYKRAHDEIKGMNVTDGSTATVAVINVTRGELTMINAGDSAGMLVTNSGAGGDRHVPAIITEEHRIANSESERERLKAAGGKLAHARGPDGRPGGPLRLWPGGVAQARAIGDADVGSFIKPDPAVCTHRFPSVGFVIVVCSDGVWDAMLPTAVGALARKLVRVPSNHAAEMIVDAAVSQLHAYDCDGCACDTSARQPPLEVLLPRFHCRACAGPACLRRSSLRRSSDTALVQLCALLCSPLVALGRLVRGQLQNSARRHDMRPDASAFCRGYIRAGGASTPAPTPLRSPPCSPVVLLLRTRFLPLPPSPSPFPFPGPTVLLVALPPSSWQGSCFTKKKKVIPPGSSPPKPEVFEKEDVDSEEVAQAVAEAVAEAGGPKPDAAPTEGKVGDSA